VKLWAKQHHGHAVGESLIVARARVSWPGTGADWIGNTACAPRHFGPLDIPGSTPPLKPVGHFIDWMDLGTWDLLDLDFGPFVS
jgi:hypothetical protein